MSIPYPPSFTSTPSISSPPPFPLSFIMPYSFTRPSFLPVFIRWEPATSPRTSASSFTPPSVFLGPRCTSVLEWREVLALNLGLYTPYHCIFGCRFGCLQGLRSFWAGLGRWALRFWSSICIAESCPSGICRLQSCGRPCRWEQRHASQFWPWRLSICVLNWPERPLFLHSYICHFR